MKTLRAHIATEVVIHLTEKVEDHLEVEVVVEEAQADHLPDHNKLWVLLKHYQESEESKSKPLMSSTEIKSKPRYSLTNSICCLKKIQTSTKLTMPKLLQQCPTSKDQMSPSGGKTRLTTFDITNSHGTNLKMSLAQSSLQSTNSSMPYSGYMTSILMTLMPSQSSTDGSLNSFREATS